jgi:hypothetical protein
MSWLGYVGLSTVLALPAAVPHQAAPSNLVFAPSQCAYSVAFLGPPALSQSTAADGGTDIAADLVRAGVRYSAACLTAALGQSAATALTPADAAARLAQMARALGVQDAAIHPLPLLGAGCAAVEGKLGDNVQPYRIEARICIAANTTFIAETIAHAGTTDTDTRKFLDSLTAK